MVTAMLCVSLEKRVAKLNGAASPCQALAGRCDGPSGIASGGAADCNSAAACEPRCSGEPRCSAPAWSLAVAVALGRWPVRRRQPAPRPRRAAPDHLLHGRGPRDARAVRLHQRSAGRRRALCRRWCGRPSAAGPVAAGRRGRAVVPREQHAPRSSAANELRARVPGRRAGEHRAAVRRRAGRDRRLGAARRRVAPARLAVNLSARRHVGAVAAGDGRRRAGRRSSAWPIRRWRAARRDGRGSGRGRASARPRGCAATGAELVIALAPLDKPPARRLAREARASTSSCSGGRSASGQARAEQVGHDASWSPPPTSCSASGASTSSGAARGPLTDAGGPEAAALRRVEIDRRSARLDDELKRVGRGATRRRSGVHRRQAPRARRAGSRSAASWTRPGRRRRRAATSPTA